MQQSEQLKRLVEDKELIIFEMGKKIVELEDLIRHLNFENE